MHEVVGGCLWSDYSYCVYMDHLIAAGALAIQLVLGFIAGWLVRGQRNA